MKKYLSFLGFLACLHSQSQTLNNLDAAKVAAKSAHKFILLDFTATWCGPCKQMEVEFWDNEQYKDIKDKFVIAKIDIDQNSSVASAYGVRAIPNIKLIDISGEELTGYEGYVSGDVMQKNLEGFPASTGDLYDIMQFDDKKQPKAEECLYIASGYQTLAQTATGAARTTFIKQSDVYFTRCKKSHPADTIAQNADLGKAFNYVLENSPKKAIKEINIEKVYDENKPFALYILSRAYADTGDKANAEKFLTMLEGFHEDYWTTAIAALRKKLQ